ncbi:MAG: bifunctional adenosylcobinamide kinase/adenosylcobinamide-phosphate guanylyltransferase [Hyphomicrobiales bacterium]|nr:bifunctional adenosylcobinamide kinase/adenosylcobinamide-phosphate guanylyltransferase [Hyphomicrobiales bacterium]
MESLAPTPIECRAVLVLGGARSGKSRYAQALAEGCAAERLYLATAGAGDAEMSARIARHQAERGEGWRTREEPLELAVALSAEAREGRVVLVDCITIWLSNALLAGIDPAERIAELAATVAQLNGPAVLVSNEVGAGIVPATSLGREFRDWQGRANQELARVCGAVVLVAAGLPTLLKPAPRPVFRLA